MEVVVHEENDYGMGSGAFSIVELIVAITTLFRKHTGRGTPSHNRKVQMHYRASRTCPNNPVVILRQVTQVRVVRSSLLTLTKMLRAPSAKTMIQRHRKQLSQ